MTGNCAELLVIFVAPFLGMPIPLLPVQILWINLMTDGLPALALTAEVEEPDVMKRAPRPPAENPLAAGVWQHILLVGGLIAGLTLAVQGLGIGGGSPWQTMVFTTMAFSQAALAMALRSDRLSVFRQGVWSNRPMLVAVAVVVGLQLLIVYLPALQVVFHTTPLSIGEIVVCVGVALAVLAFVEAWKQARTRMSNLAAVNAAAI